MSEEFASHKILLIDDEVLLIELLEMQLQALGCTTITANNGEEALQKLEANADISLVISDIKMPVMDGITFLKKIRDQGSIVPVMFFSAYGDKATLKQAWKEGAYDFLEKPIREEDLLRKVKTALLFGKEYQLSGRTGDQEKKSAAFMVNSSVIEKFNHYCRTKNIDTNQVVENLITRYLASGN